MAWEPSNVVGAIFVALEPIEWCFKPFLMLLRLLEYFDSWLDGFGAILCGWIQLDGFWDK